MHSSSRSASVRGMRQGTTLIEILVVIVVFLVGILAVIQIFPKGFQILVASRNTSMATALARDEVERLKSRPEQLPEAIVTARLVNGSYVSDSTHSSTDLGPLGNQLLADGTLRLDNSTLGDWQLFSGPNATRRVIGEGRRVPAPRAVGIGSAFFGGLMLLQFGPIDYRPVAGNLSVYGNDLQSRIGDVAFGETWSDAEFFITSPDTDAVSVRLPSGPQLRSYRVSFSAYLQTGGKRDYIDPQPVQVPASALDASGNYPLYTVSLQSLVGDDIGNADLNTLRVQRQYLQLPQADAFGSDPYEYKLLDTNLGVLLFNPQGYSTYVLQPGGGRQPLQARVNYDVYDWRVLREEFRLSPGGGTQQYKLAVPSLKVAGQSGPDGRANTNIVVLESAPTTAGLSDTSAADEARANNLVLVDLDTGGVVMERLPSDNRPPSQATSPLIQVNKSTGVITFNDSDNNANNGTTGKLLLPDGTVRDVQLENRALRALYRARNEFAVQVLKAPSQYTEAPDSTNLGIGQFYVGGNGGSSPTRLYFPPSDAGRKVTIGEINYLRSDGSLRQMFGQDFIIRRAGALDNVGLPYIDLAEADANAAQFNFGTGTAARSVKGSSVAVRVLWNPDSFSLTNDQAANIAKLDAWGRGWRRSVNETYIERGEAIH